MGFHTPCFIGHSGTGANFIGVYRHPWPIAPLRNPRGGCHLPHLPQEIQFLLLALSDVLIQ